MLYSIFPNSIRYMGYTSGGSLEEEVEDHPKMYIVKRLKSFPL
jgi:hypothetical protein